MDIYNTTNNSDWLSKIMNFDIVGFLGNSFQFLSDLFTPHSQYAHFWDTVKMILALVAIFFIFIIAYCIVRLLEIRKKEHAYLHHEIEEYKHKHTEDGKKKEEISQNKQWLAVLEYIFSENQGDWKLAVIEADSMLDTLMDQLGFKGEGLGEKLKSADPEKFRSLTVAWEVHTIRNRIAHEGANFELSKHEAKRVIAIYEDIFRQYGFI